MKKKFWENGIAPIAIPWARGGGNARSQKKLYFLYGLYGTRILTRSPLDAHDNVDDVHSFEKVYPAE